MKNLAEQEIVLFGAERCRKTQFYLNYLQLQSLEFTFKDVEKNEDDACELRALYENGKLNFPTFTIKGRKLRNPSIEQLEKKLLELKN